MNQTPNIDDLYCAQLDSWKDFLSGALQNQSDSSHAGLSLLTNNSDNIATHLLHYAQRQVDIWITMEQQALHIVFNLLKETDPIQGISPQCGHETVEKILLTWSEAADKSLEAHTDYYRLIFPWNDGDEATSRSGEPTLGQAPEDTTTPAPKAA